MLRALAVPIRGLGWWTIAQVLFVRELVQILGALLLNARAARFDRDLFVGELRRTGVAALTPVVGLAGLLGAYLLLRLLSLPGGAQVERYVFRQVIVEVGPVVVAATLLLHAAPLLAGALGLEVATAEGRRHPLAEPTEDPFGVSGTTSDPVFLMGRVAPRVAGAAVSAALLWGLFSVVGLLAASAMALVVTKADVVEFLHRQVAAVPPWAMLDALVRATTFGAAIALVALHEAFRTKTPRHLPTITRLAVVRGFFVCLVLFGVSHAPALLGAATR